MANSARYTKEQIVRLGRQIYERDIRPQVEVDHDGRFVAVDVSTGGYELADEELAAFERAERRNPDGVFFLLRVGRPAAHRLGGSLGGRATAAGS